MCMKDFEEFLKKAIEKKNQLNSVNCIPIDKDGRMIIDKLILLMGLQENLMKTYQILKTLPSTQ